MISHILIAAGAAITPVQTTPAEAAKPPLSLENRTLLRCAAAFALIARAQENGEEASQKWPELGDRGREFFVRALAQVIDQTDYGRNDVAQATGEQALEIRQLGDLDKIMPACLLMLENSGT